MKYNEAIKKRVFEMWSEGGWTQKQICKAVGVTEDTFIRWKNTKKEFSELIERAEQKKFENFKALAENGLKKLLNGVQVEEWKKEYKKTGTDEQGKPTYGLVETERRLKNYLPNVAAVIHALNNRDPKNWKDRRNVDLTTQGEKIQVFRIGDQEVEF